MSRARQPLSSEKQRALREQILSLLSEGEDNAKPLGELEMAFQNIAQWEGLPRLRFVEEVGRLRSEGLVSAKRRVGYWKHSAGVETPATEPVEQRAAEEVPAQKSKESDYYPAVKAWLEGRYGCYAEDVSERGKRGRRRGGERLVAVPDVIGVRYFPGPSKDYLQLIAIEVKVGMPSSHDVSEAYRYTRFADL